MVVQKVPPPPLSSGRFQKFQTSASTTIYDSFLFLDLFQIYRIGDPKSHRSMDIFQIVNPSSEIPDSLPPPGSEK